MSVLASTANVWNRFTCAFTIAFFLGDALVSPSRRTQPDAIKAAPIASTAVWMDRSMAGEKSAQKGEVEFGAKDADDDPKPQTQNHANGW